MELKELKKYTDRELLEFIVSNQVRMEKHLYEVTNIVIKSNPKIGNKFQLLLDEAYNNLLDSQMNLNHQIEYSKHLDKD